MSALDQVFQQEKAWIAGCEDVDALIDRIGDWRDSAREAERNGHMLLRMRAGDLIELAQRRVVGLQAREMRAEKATKKPVSPAVESRASKQVPAPMRPMPTVASVQRQPPPAPPVAPTREARPVGAGPCPVVDGGHARRAAEAEVAWAAAEKAKADARVAAAEAERIELQNALLWAQVEAARRAPAPTVQVSRVPVVGAGAGPRRAASAVAAGVAARAPGLQPVATPASPKRPSAAPPPRPPAAKSSLPKSAPAKPTLIDGYTEADRLALASVGRWPPTPPERRGAFWSRDDDWPGEWTLTGGELGRFRGEINLTRAVLAAQLGVPSAMVKDAEMKPREKLCPAMQIAVRRAMDLERARRAEARGQQRARAEQAAVPAPTVEVLDGVGVAAAATPPREAAAAAFTGADLARFRAARGLTQKEAADFLGVEQGTISKGEAKGDAALGPALQVAMTRVGGVRAAE